MFLPLIAASLECSSSKLWALWISSLANIGSKKSNCFKELKKMRRENWIKLLTSNFSIVITFFWFWKPMEIQLIE